MSVNFAPSRFADRRVQTPKLAGPWGAVDDARRRVETIGVLAPVRPPVIVGAIPDLERAAGHDDGEARHASGARVFQPQRGVAGRRRVLLLSELAGPVDGVNARLHPTDQGRAAPRGATLTKHVGYVF